MRKNILKSAVCAFMATVLLLGDAGAVMAADIDGQPAKTQKLGVQSNMTEDVKSSKSIAEPYIKQTGATTNSITLSWNKFSDNNMYCRIYYQGQSSTNAYFIENVSPSAGAITISDLRANEAYAVYFTVYDSTKNDFIIVDRCIATVQPTQATGISNYIMDVKSDSNVKGYFKFTEQTCATAYEYNVYNYKGKVIKHGTLKETIEVSGKKYLQISGLKTGTFYSVSFRAISKAEEKSSTSYGSWSSKCYFSAGPKKSSCKAAVGTKKLTVKWGKVTGAKNYTIYVSDKKSSGYKKVKTTSKRLLTISKYKGKKLKSKKTYYVKIVANKKVGSKTFKSTQNIVFKKKVK